MGQILLRHGEIGVEPVERGQRGDFIAGVQVLAQIDPPHTDLPGKGGDNALLRDPRIVLPHRGDGLIVFRPPLIEHFTRFRASGRQFARPGQLQPGEFRLGRRGGAVRAFGPIEQLHERRPGPDMRPRLEPDRGNTARHFGRQHHFLNRAQGTDRFERIRHIARLHKCRSHDRRRRRGLCGRGIAPAPPRKQQQENDNDEADCHCGLPPWQDRLLAGLAR